MQFPYVNRWERGVLLQRMQRFRYSYRIVTRFGSTQGRKRGGSARFTSTGRMGWILSE